MSLAHSPLLNHHLDDLLSMDTSDVIAFTGEYSPFIAVSTPPPSLSRSSSYGYESDASCTSVSGFSNHGMIKSTFGATPTSIDSYYPASNEYDPYTQLAALWSSSSAQQDRLARASMVTSADPVCYASNNDDLVSLFISQAPPKAKSPKNRSATATTIPTTATTSSSPITKPTKLKSSKKCTYAARRREVSALRKETSELETQLLELQSKLHTGRGHTRESVDLEKILLACARKENERLRAVVMTQEAQIRRCDGLFSSSSNNMDADGSAM